MILLPQVAALLSTISSRRWEGWMQTLPWVLECWNGQWACFIQRETNLPEETAGCIGLFHAAPHYQRGPFMTGHVPNMQETRDLSLAPGLLSSCSTCKQSTKLCLHLKKSATSGTRSTHALNHSRYFHYRLKTVIYICSLSTWEVGVADS